MKSALFQLAGRLRENFFSRIGYKGAKTGYSSCTAISSSSPGGIEAAFSTQSAQLSTLSHIDELDHLGFVEQVRVFPTSLWLYHVVVNSRKCCLYDFIVLTSELFLVHR